MAFRSTTRLAAGAILIAGVAAGCAGATRANNPSWPGTQPAARNQVQVTNRNWSPVDIYVVYGGRNFHIGTVPSSHTATLDIPETFADSAIRLAAQPVGGGEGYVTPVVVWTKGQGLRLIVESDVSRSSFSIG